MEMTYTYGSMLLIYGFLGWCCEVLFAAHKSHKFVNRGFLNGPICPIYGFGMVFLYMASRPFEQLNLALRWIIAFVFSMVIASAVELLTGWILEKFFHKKWWDYSKRKFNIGGYICLEFSLLWGAAGSVMTMLVNPAVIKLIDISPKYAVFRILWLVLLAALLIDFILTLAEILNISKKIKASAELEKLFKGVSDGVGEGLYDAYVKLDEKIDDKRPEFEEKKKELTDKVAKYKHILYSNNFVHKRLIKAFPNIGGGNHLALINKFQEMYRKLVKDAKERKKAEK